MKKILRYILIFVTLGLALFFVFQMKTEEKINTELVPIINPVACTQEAKLCPDGSSVGRTGPNCEFALCPVTSSKKSGITGTVTLSPICPVERIPPDPQCAPRPFATTIEIVMPGSDLLIQPIQSDANGKFSIDLASGTYIVRAQGGNLLPRCPQVSAVVKSGQYTTVNISCDTGIR